MTDSLKLSSLRPKQLVKEIFNSNSPEAIVKQVPAQTLYLAVLQLGLQNSVELLEIATTDQLRTIIDLDCWNQDSLDEDKFWDWLEVTDATEGLTLLSKILSCFDLRIIGLAINKYISVITQTEPTENPPDINFYTPDNGYTWLLINTEDSKKHFLLGRLLALIFETNTELFYQLISLPSVTTCTQLEEESFLDKEKRLANEGIPDIEFAAQINTPVQPEILLEQDKRNSQRSFKDIKTIYPLIIEGKSLNRLESILSEQSLLAETEPELCLIINAAIVNWRINLDDYEELIFTIDRVKGILNIGVEILEKSSKKTGAELYSTLTLQSFYSAGLFKLLQLKKHIKKIDIGTLKIFSGDTTQINSFVSGLNQRIPVLPKWFNSDVLLDTSDNDQLSELGILRAEYRAIGSLEELNKIYDCLSEKKN